MTLLVTLMNQEGLIRPFSLANTPLEVGFEIINNIVREGDRLIEAKILLDHTCTPLPVEAFDGHSCLLVLTNMMAEWDQILMAPLRTGLSDAPRCIDDLKFHKTCIARLELAIAFYEQKRHQSQSATDHQLLLDQLQTTIARYQAILASQRTHLQTLQ
ncbi:hypothetical protein BH09BAC4_BH09BAC4_33280 [soil metagenome]